MYTIKLLFGDSQGGAPGFQGGGQKTPPPPLNATLYIYMYIYIYIFQAVRRAVNVLNVSTCIYSVQVRY